MAFDSEIIPEKPAAELNIEGFKTIFKEKTGEELTDQALRKLELVKEMKGELKEYPNLELRWKEVGLSFQVQFVKLDYLEKQERVENIKQELQQELHKSTLYSEVLLCLINSASSRQDISIALGQKKVSGQLNKVVQKLITDHLIERTIPDKPNHPAQKFQLTERGVIFLRLLGNAPLQKKG